MLAPMRLALQLIMKFESHNINLDNTSNDNICKFVRKIFIAVKNEMDDITNRAKGLPGASSLHHVKLPYTKMIQQYYQSQEDIDYSFATWQFTLKQLDLNVLTDVFNFLDAAQAHLMQLSQRHEVSQGQNQGQIEGDRWLVSSIQTLALQIRDAIQQNVGENEFEETSQLQLTLLRIDQRMTQNLSLYWQRMHYDPQRAMFQEQKL